jgi:glycosyltransferase involved in cell wall biosynthesis
MADIVVLPSHREGLPLVVLEAQAAGKPVVGTSATGIIDVVTNEETGLLAPVGDVPALGAAMERLLNDKRLAVRLGLAGQERVRRKFQQEQIWEALHAEYLAVLQTEETRESLSPYSASAFIPSQGRKASLLKRPQRT